MKIYVNDEVAKKLFPDGTKKPLDDVFYAINHPDFKAVVSSLGLEDKDWGMVFRMALNHWRHQAGLVSSQPSNKLKENGDEIDFNLFD